MTAREKNLSIAVGAVVLFLVNYLLIEFFFTNEKKLRGNFIRKSAELGSYQLILKEKELWEKRNAQLDALQPKLTRESEVTAAGALFDQIKEIAQKSNVVPEEPLLGVLDKSQPYYMAVSDTFAIKSSWQSLCSALRGMQGPGQFMVFESAVIQVDSADKTLHRGEFKLAKWYAPN
ncbi:MAG: hypothetical protein JWL90_4280 [Chthoniobacteraceae bacterium]|nr:hypothetical protein [Chthoniobacteraceae bacterium]